MLKYKLVSVFLFVYGLIGATVLVLIGMQQPIAMFICLLLYVFIPLISAVGLWRKNKAAILLAILPFLYQSVRYVDDTSFLPSIAPITIAFPISTFEGGKGFLIDYLAIAVIVYLIYLYKQVRSATA